MPSRLEEKKHLINKQHVVTTSFVIPYTDRNIYIFFKSLNNYHNIHHMHLSNGTTYSIA